MEDQKFVKNAKIIREHLTRCEELITSNNNSCVLIYGNIGRLNIDEVVLQSGSFTGGKPTIILMVIEETLKNLLKEHKL